jgi:hypothetical protein
MVKYFSIASRIVTNFLGLWRHPLAELLADYNEGRAMCVHEMLLENLNEFLEQNAWSEFVVMELSFCPPFFTYHFRI